MKCIVHYNQEFIEKCKNVFSKFNPIDTNLPIKVGENTVHCASSCELESRYIKAMLKPFTDT